MFLSTFLSIIYENIEYTEKIICKRNTYRFLSQKSTVFLSIFCKSVIEKYAYEDLVSIFDKKAQKAQKKKKNYSIFSSTCAPLIFLLLQLPQKIGGVARIFCSYCGCSFIFKLKTFVRIDSRKFAALCETGEKPLISIWDLQSLKRKRLLGIPYDTTGAISSFKCLDFSFDSKYIAAVTSENQAMLFYNWEKGKLESNLDLVNTHNPESRVTCISCNPSDIALVAVGGPYCFKMLTLSETLWRPFGFTKADNIIVTSVTWLNSDRILAGTSDGRILFLENGELKQVFKASETMFMNMKIRDENAIQLSTSANPNESDVSHAIMCLLTFSRGFVFAYGYGMIVVFEKDGNHKYLKRNVYVIPRQISNEESSHLYKINRISSNISSDKLIITTGWSQLFCATLWGPDLQTDPEPQLVQTISFHLHHGAIGGLSTCTWKSHIRTFGKIDRSVRMWDYETESLIMVKQYSEDIFCVVLHPSGLFCLIGFSDKLRFESVLLDNFETIKEFSIRGCKIAAFSFGGHLFAAVNGNIIQVFSTIDFENRFVLKGI